MGRGVKGSSKAEPKLPLFAAFISYFEKSNSTAIIEFFYKVLDSFSLTTNIFLGGLEFPRNLGFVVSGAKHLKDRACSARCIFIYKIC